MESNLVICQERRIHELSEMRETVRHGDGKKSACIILRSKDASYEISRFREKIIVRLALSTDFKPWVKGKQSLAFFPDM